jgi:CheY-like chemotaxis protein
MRILLVEDDRYFLGILRDYLSHIGIEVFEAADGQAGLELAESHEADLVLTDVLMPRVSGLELAAQIKEKGGDNAPPVVLMSAVYQNEEDIRSNLRQCGADDYLIKPFTMEELYRKLSTYLPLERPSPLGEGRGGAGDTLTLVPGWQGDLEVATGGEIQRGFLAKLMLDVRSASHTGVLEMVDGSRWKNIVFLNGYPMWSDGGGTHNRLGTMLLEERTITEEQFASAVQFMRDRGLDFGSALTDNGILSSTELYRQLRRLVQRRVISAFAWAVGTWTLSSTFPKQASSFEVQPLLAVWRGLRSYGDLDAMQAVIAEHEDSFVIPTNRYQSDWTVLKVEETFDALGAFVNGRRTVADLRELEVCVDDELCCGLWLMFQAGMVGFAPQPAQSAQLSSSVGGASPHATLLTETVPADLPPGGETILHDYLRHWQSDFFSLFDLPMSAADDAVQKALLVSPVSWAVEDLGPDLPGDIRAKAKALIAWIEEGRVTLGSEELRAAYRERLQVGATGVYRSVSAPDRTEAAMFFEKGKGFVRLHNYVEAEQAFASAVSSDPETPEYLAYRAWAGYRRAGGTATAVRDARKMLAEALRGDLHQPMAHYFIGLIHRDQNEFTAAQAALAQAVRYDPAFEPARKALDQVDELTGTPR